MTQMGQSRKQNHSKLVKAVNTFNQDKMKPKLAGQHPTISPLPIEIKPNDSLVNTSALTPNF